jgi:hypothetical protein
MPFALVEDKEDHARLITQTYAQQRAWRKTALKRIYDLRDDPSTTLIGQYSEMRVAYDLMLHGFDVFIPTGRRAHCDLVAIKDQLIKRVEVKSSIRRESGIIGSLGLTTDQRIRQSDVHAFVSCLWEIRYRPEMNLW